jgi:hypothetical protein
MILLLDPLEVDVLRGYLGEILATNKNDVIENIYLKLVEEN